MRHHVRPGEARAATSLCDWIAASACPLGVVTAFASPADIGVFAVVAGWLASASCAVWGLSRTRQRSVLERVLVWVGAMWAVLGIFVLLFVALAAWSASQGGWD